MTVKISIQGIKSANRFLNIKKLKTKTNIKNAMFVAGTFLQGEVKQSIAGRKAEPTSVDTGRFLNSVDLTASKDSAVIFSKVPYAKFLEFGTTRINRRKHFSNSLARNKFKIIGIINNQVKKI